MKTADALVALQGAKVRTARQGTLAVFRPDGGAAGAVLAVHGSGRGIADYTDTPFYAMQKDIAVGYGFAFAVLENGPDTYGTDDGVYNLSLAADALLGLLHLDRITLWATSAGGVCALRYAADHREQTAAVIGTFPVADLNSVFPILASCRRAWDAEELTPEEFSVRIRGKNPPELIGRLRGIPMFLSHGTADRAVPYRENSVLLERIGAYLHTVPGGIHGTEDYRYYAYAPHAAFHYLNMRSGSES